MRGVVESGCKRGESVRWERESGCEWGESRERERGVGEEEWV